MGNEQKHNPIHSLRFQLCAGAIALLGVAIVSISSLLIAQQKNILMKDLQNAIVLQGRNVSLGSAKGLMRTDPEFELVPLVTRITEGNRNILSIVITDPDGIIHADLELQNIGAPIEATLEAFVPADTDQLVETEALLEDESSFLFRTPVIGLNKILGFVHMTYSKRQLAESVRHAILITALCSSAAFILGIILSLWLFRRISHPMDVMVKGVEAFGQGDLQARISLPTRNEFHILANSFNTMASTLVDAQRELIDKKVLDRELEIAHDLQSALIPKGIHDPDGYEIGMFYKSARQVGGDYLDVINIGANRLAFIMSDVSGKGIPGLVITAMLKIMVRQLVRTSPDVRWVMRDLNDALSEHMRQNMFVTMFLGILDTDTGVLKYTNAGHNPILHYTRATGDCRFDRIKGRPLGMFADESFFDRLRQNEVTLREGDLFLLYTDGLSEARNGEREQFGYDRIWNVCRDHAETGAKSLVQNIITAEMQFRGHSPQLDDLTVLAVRAMRRPLLHREKEEEEQIERCLSLSEV